MGIAAILINRPSICTNFRFPFNRMLRIKFEENWYRGFRGDHSKVWTDRWTNGRLTDNYGRQVITIAYPEPSAQVS